MTSFDLDHPRLTWAADPAVRPFVFRRTGTPEAVVDPRPRPWFPNAPLVEDPLTARAADFADLILKVDGAAYAASQMAMPRWVFYDCGLIPGVVAGYAIHRTKASPALMNALAPRADDEWLPLSLFFMIPSQIPGEWVAHNLCSVNTVLPEDERRYGLGFLTKAFALWSAGARTLCGVTQWTSPALRLHAHFGPFEILGAYTRIHSHPATLTYRVELDPAVWPGFFGPPKDPYRVPRGLGSEIVDPKSAESLKSFQRRLEQKDARYYLNADQMSNRAPHDALTVYKREPTEGY